MLAKVSHHRREQELALARPYLGYQGLVRTKASQLLARGGQGPRNAPQPSERAPIAGGWCRAPTLSSSLAIPIKR